MRARLLHGSAAALAALCASCPALGPGEETFEGAPTESSDRIPVVDDIGPFDPREAVDDDDGNAALADQDDPNDGSAFANVDAHGRPAAGREGAENERTSDELDDEREPVAEPAQVAARAEERAQEVEAVDDAGAGDEDQRKAALARNPAPEPRVDSEGLWGRAADMALETLLVALVAALFSAAIVFARSHVKTVAVGSILLGAVTWFVWSQVA